MIERLALRFATKKRAPTMIPLTGERAAANDFYSVYIVSKDEKWGVLVESVQDEGVVGKSFEGDSYENLCGARWRDIAGMTYNFRHYYRGYEFVETSPLKFLLMELLFIYRVYIFKEKVGQFLFNQRTLVRHQRIEVLKRLVENYLESDVRQYTCHPFSYLNRVHGKKWILHPEKDRILRYYLFMFDSLVSSGDLTKDHPMSYKVNPSALVTLSGFEEEERKHKDAIRQQRMLVVLTVALVLVGLAQVAVEYFRKAA